MARQNYSDQFMAERIGITMRVGQAAGSGESRDCLAQDWARYMAALAPDVAWVPIPNLGAAVAEFIQHWQLDGFILSGGNDLGTCPIRDKTENTVIDHAVRNALAVFGVCRGMQLLQQRGGGALSRCEPKTHLAQKHTVHLRTDLLEFDAPGRATVNSFHNWAVPANTLAPSLELLAASDDGCVEAVRHRAAPIAAVQWHPERDGDNLQAQLDQNLLCTTLGWKK
jgi:putative glutamine amidotransferase